MQCTHLPLALIGFWMMYMGSCIANTLVRREGGYACDAKRRGTSEGCERLTRGKDSGFTATRARARLDAERDARRIADLTKVRTGRSGG